MLHVYVRCVSCGCATVVRRPCEVLNEDAARRSTLRSEVCDTLPRPRLSRSRWCLCLTPLSHYPPAPRLASNSLVPTRTTDTSFLVALARTISLRTPPTHPAPVSPNRRTGHRSCPGSVAAPTPRRSPVHGGAQHSAAEHGTATRPPCDCYEPLRVAGWRLTTAIEGRDRGLGARGHWALRRGGWARTG